MADTSSYISSSVVQARAFELVFVAVAVVSTHPDFWSLLVLLQLVVPLISAHEILQSWVNETPVSAPPHVMFSEVQSIAATL
jgi:hypothetical protein